MGDDDYHNGAFMLAANFWFYSSFMPRQGAPIPPQQALQLDPGTPDGYDFFLHMGPLGEANKRFFNGESGYLQEVVDHPNYDSFWQARSLPKNMNNVKCAVLNVGGWFDAEDPAGPLSTYHAVEKNNPGTVNELVMGPWRHGGWARGNGDKLGNVDFGSNTAAFFREQIQFPFFMYYLKDKKVDLPEAYLFMTGLNEWHRLDHWPPRDATPTTLYFNSGGKLAATRPADADGFDEYLSDPNHPVPYVGYTGRGMIAEYITEDQRFASERPDVLTYQSEPLDHDMIVTGPIKINLNVSTTGTDSDFVVKVIDVYPGTYPTPPTPDGQPVLPNAVKLGGYQQLLRGEPFRGKFRNSFEKPEAFVPGQPAAINFELPDVYHAFRNGHRIMVQVQSSWFPLVDRNPQKFMDIPKAKDSDFQKATERIFRSAKLSSSITFSVQAGGQ